MFSRINDARSKGEPYRCKHSSRPFTCRIASLTIDQVKDAGEVSGSALSHSAIHDGHEPAWFCLWQQGVISQ
jgi:hypothetical protein